MSEIVSQPGKHHSCHVGWESRPLSDDHPSRKHGFTTYLHSVGDWDSPGTIRQCECGKTWVGYRQSSAEGIRQGMRILTTQWRPEGRFERWRRERRQRAQARDKKHSRRHEG